MGIFRVSALDRNQDDDATRPSSRDEEASWRRVENEEREDSVVNPLLDATNGEQDKPLEERTGYNSVLAPDDPSPHPLNPDAPANPADDAPGGRYEYAPTDDNPYTGRADNLTDMAAGGNVSEEDLLLTNPSLRFDPDGVPQGEEGFSVVFLSEERLERLRALDSLTGDVSSLSALSDEDRLEVELLVNQELMSGARGNGYDEGRLDTALTGVEDDLTDMLSPTEGLAELIDAHREVIEEEAETLLATNGLGEAIDKAFESGLDHPGAWSEFEGNLAERIAEIEETYGPGTEAADMATVDLIAALQFYGPHNASTGQPVEGFTSALDAAHREATVLHYTEQVESAFESGGQAAAAQTLSEITEGMDGSRVNMLLYELSEGDDSVIGQIVSQFEDPDFILDNDVSTEFSDEALALFSDLSTVVSRAGGPDGSGPGVDRVVDLFGQADLPFDGFDGANPAGHAFLGLIQESIAEGGGAALAVGLAGQYAGDPESHRLIYDSIAAGTSLLNGNLAEAQEDYAAVVLGDPMLVDEQAEGLASEESRNQATAALSDAQENDADNAERVERFDRLTEGATYTHNVLEGSFSYVDDDFYSDGRMTEAKDALASTLFGDPQDDADTGVLGIVEMRHTQKMRQALHEAFNDAPAEERDTALNDALDTYQELSDAGAGFESVDDAVTDRFDTLIEMPRDEAVASLSDDADEALLLLGTVSGESQALAEERPDIYTGWQNRAGAGFTVFLSQRAIPAPPISLSLGGQTQISRALPANPLATDATLPSTGSLPDTGRTPPVSGLQGNVFTGLPTTAATFALNTEGLVHFGGNIGEDGRATVEGGIYAGVFAGSMAYDAAYGWQLGSHALRNGVGAPFRPGPVLNASGVGLAGASALAFGVSAGYEFAEGDWQMGSVYTGAAGGFGLITAGGARALVPAATAARIPAMATPLGWGAIALTAAAEYGINEHRERTYYEPHMQTYLENLTITAPNGQERAISPERAALLAEGRNDGGGHIGHSHLPLVEALADYRDVEPDTLFAYLAAEEEDGGIAEADLRELLATSGDLDTNADGTYVEDNPEAQALRDDPNGPGYPVDPLATSRLSLEDISRLAEENDFDLPGAHPHDI